MLRLGAGELWGGQSRSRRHLHGFQGRAPWALGERVTFASSRPVQWGSAGRLSRRDGPYWGSERTYSCRPEVVLPMLNWSFLEQRLAAAVRPTPAARAPLPFFDHEPQVALGARRARLRCAQRPLATIGRTLQSPRAVSGWRGGFRDWAARRETVAAAHARLVPVQIGGVSPSRRLGCSSLHQRHRRYWIPV